MHIIRIELENIKSHVDAAFEFERGTTAIMGENGAGKTTLIEAVAWTLFDVLDYKKEDFVRRGAKRGSVRVTFESGLDERRYTVYRDTNTGYNVYDPGLKMRIADKKEEVCRFLWQHLGVDPGTDLDSLFRRAIGVPQGTFTAIFLETPAERKKAFDKLLKVEEYRRGAEELLRTARFIDQQTAAVRERIARAEGEVARIDSVEDEHERFAAEVGDLGMRLEQIVSDAAERQASVEILDKAEAELNDAKVLLEARRNDQARLNLILAQKQSELAQARDAAARIAEVKSDSEKHNAAVLRLRELERERVEREKLRESHSKVEAALAAVRTDQKYSNDALENALKARAAINQLKQAAVEEDRLEKTLGTLRDLAAQSKAIASQIGALEEKIQRLRESYRANKEELSVALDKANSASGLETLEKRDETILRELASLNAALERDERFQREIQNGLCPILSQKCLNLKEGETLDDFVTSQFSDLRTRIAFLETEHGQVAVALQTSREAEKFLKQLATLQAREKEIADEGKRLNEEQASLQTQLETLPKIEGELAEAESALRALANPRAKIQLLEVEARREGDLSQKLSNTEANVERLDSDRKILVEQLEMYKDFDQHWGEATATRDTTADAQRIYLTNETLAGSVGERQSQVETATKEAADIERLVTESKDRVEAAEASYDRHRHTSLRSELLALQKQQAELAARLDASRRRAGELEAELVRLREIKKTIQSEFNEKDRLEKSAELTTFIRDTLKEAAPLVARNYVHHVSLEANNMFREITGNAEHTLKWVEDYGIQLEEDGYERPFGSLSGGEQMAAALSVRLALLKQLTDIRIAFFDEPTTNMDAERRENLAMQLAGLIKHFDQLFVISHDDTFEGYVDNVVTVKRGENEESIQRALGEAN
ncbi:MAG TPA: SMC family ATPase [Pyrinomonadaceae bacterium]|nr:SMC family ATPase [Pyrinomonadaceae bacterium]